MRAWHGESLASVRGATRFASGADAPRPHVAVFGAVHGNEPCGLEALARLGDDFSSGRVPLRRGTVLLVHGNPRASEHASRTSPGGVDLNRLFDYRFLDDLPRHRWAPEHERALELRPLLDDLDAAVDLHSTTRPTPAFAIATLVPASETMASALGLDYVTVGWEGPGLLGDRVLFAPLTRRDRPAVGVECGQHEHPNAPRIAYEAARRALAWLGLTDPLPPPSGHRGPRRLVVRDAIKKPSPGFRFDPPIDGLCRLAAGERVGQDENLVVAVRRDCFALMPNDDVRVGLDMLYLAVEEP